MCNVLWALGLPSPHGSFMTLYGSQGSRCFAHVPTRSNHVWSSLAPKKNQHCLTIPIQPSMVIHPSIHPHLLNHKSWRLGHCSFCTLLRISCSMPRCAGVQLVKGGTRHAILAAVGAHGGGLRWTFGPAAAPTTPGAWHWELGDGTKTMGKWWKKDGGSGDVWIYVLIYVVMWYYVVLF